MVDGYTNIVTLKLFPHREREHEYTRESLQENVEKVRAMTRLTTGMDASMAAWNGLMIAGTTGIGMWLWSHGHITVGAAAFASGLAIRISNMSGWIMWVINGVFENIGTVQDGINSIALPATVDDAPDAKDIGPVRGDIRFEHVTFHYGKQGGVIEGLDLHVRPGEKVGLVGRSGAGKSTLVNLLLRFYDREGGAIRVDGTDIATVTQDSLRAAIGVVTQDTSLLHRSVRENILYGRPDASQAEVEAAAAQGGGGGGGGGTDSAAGPGAAGRPDAGADGLSLGPDAEAGRPGAAHAGGFRKDSRRGQRRRRHPRRHASPAEFC